ncbi:MAG: sulfatase family protein [Planctomycetota bacterium]|jgi:arylsulfatase A-like enzyme
MNRREFLRTCGSAAAALSPLALCLAEDRRRPNVIFIITDDQNLDSFAFLRHKALTPNIDRLARDGVYFSRAYASSSVCTPSRYTCLTGRYASRSRHPKFLRGISAEGQTWVHWNADMTYGEDNVAKLLRRAGYVTGIVGKLHGFELPGHSKSLRNDSDPDDPKVRTLLEADQATFARELKRHGFDFAQRLHRGNLQSMKNFPDILRQHNPEWAVEGALDFIETNKDRPFYLYFATTLLHGPSPLRSLKSDPRATEAGLLDSPPKVQPPRKSVLERVRAVGLPESAAPATWLDDSVGAILNKLKKLNLNEDTLIVYFNDHGHEGGKGTLYEGGVRTPTIMYWPGTIMPTVCDELVENIDFVPTILSACRVVPPEGTVIDGMDLMPVLTGRSTHTRDSLYCEIGHTRAVITKRWKCLAFRVPPTVRQAWGADPTLRITHIHRVAGGDGTERGQGLKHYAKHYFDPDQLYDLQNDPREENSLADKPEYEHVLRKMQDLLRSHLARVPGTFGEFRQ